MFTNLKRLMVNAAIVFLSVAPVLFISEVVIRVYAKMTLQDRAITFDPELGWRPLPNVRKVGFYWGVARPASTNSKGWRDAERSYDKPEGVRRAVAIGDSMVFGMSVDDGERFTELLGRRFNQFEVINLGVTGYGTDQAFRALEVEGFRYQPDVVILTIHGNDLEDIRHELRHTYPKPVYTLEGGQLRLRKPSTTWDLSVRQASYLAEFAFMKLRNHKNDSRLAPAWKNADVLPLFAAIVRSIAEETTRRRARLVALLAYLPDRIEAEPTEEEQRMRAVLEEARIPTLDTRAMFAPRVRAGEVLYSSDGWHWNVRGNEVVADAIQEFLLAKGWLD